MAYLSGDFDTLVILEAIISPLSFTEFPLLVFRDYIAKIDYFLFSSSEWSLCLTCSNVVSINALILGLWGIVMFRSLGFL
jgi:hypothetical protein